MKTAIKQAQEEIKRQLQDIRGRYNKPNEDKRDKDRATGLLDALDVLQSLLPAEQKAIEDAFDAGADEQFSSPETAFDYFTQTYNNGE